GSNLMTIFFAELGVCVHNNTDITIKFPSNMRTRIAKVPPNTPPTTHQCCEAKCSQACFFAVSHKSPINSIKEIAMPSQGLACLKNSFVCCLSSPAKPIQTFFSLANLQKLHIQRVAPSLKVLQ